MVGQKVSFRLSTRQKYKDFEEKVLLKVTEFKNRRNKHTGETGQNIYRELISAELQNKHDNSTVPLIRDT